MSDDKNKRGKPDRDRVNINEPYEVRQWTEYWGVTEAQLRRCVERVGVMVKDVERCLGK